ncbi:hypothetical protein CK625_04445 [Vandammella animalimorsus]|uniref:Uncharacterized protein n=1 Tax=Vandammella animalimorsus TaxID=2029117 RepID=A0A2A2AG66_9BURK|nr:hypothetical protein CK625_04445 [Vandammella animalimorsus]
MIVKLSGPARGRKATDQGNHAFTRWMLPSIMAGLGRVGAALLERLRAMAERATRSSARCVKGGRVIPTMPLFTAKSPGRAWCPVPL